MVERDDGTMLASIQGTPLPVEYTILVTVQGAVPELGVEFNELAWFDQGDLSFEAPGEIQVTYGADPRSWDGWDRFDAER
jgi:hypothetical protein